MNEIYIYILEGVAILVHFFYYIIGEGTFKDDFKDLDLFSFFWVQWCTLI